MINESTLYWVTRLDSFHVFLTCLILILIALTVFSFLYMIDLCIEYDRCPREWDAKQKLFDFRMRVVWFAICLFFLFTSG